MSKKISYGDNILKGLFGENKLRTLFEQQLLKLEITETSALEILQIERRALDGILDGTQRRIDFTTLPKLAKFLEIPTEELVTVYLNQLEKNFSSKVSEAEKRKFIAENFDLPTLRKAGFINSITDYSQIEKTIVDYFGYDTIFEYRKDKIGVAYSWGGHKPKNSLNRDLWVESSFLKLRKINNYYPYDREKLLAFFPRIRWYSTNVEKGLYQVIRELFKLGVTVIFESYLPTINVRGATFSVSDKPCISLTNYTNYYPSLWFALIHELHHVLFDWDEIVTNTYLVSGEKDLFSQNEIEADAFARDYLFGKEQMDLVLPHINNEIFIDEYAKNNHIHPSFIYIFYSWDNKDLDKNVWARYIEYFPDIETTLKSLGANPWQNKRSIRDSVKQLKSELYNDL
jgi:HTH-type transcriptional regulator/antitoxin HigA